ncbi:triacylglycerol hydrolase DDHD2 [Onthophagus taurus]|uniref:triacylglycerol hydrolase DDHD2 n=1 Tax=Onthophagus taurus TaxID=166361 RepID=UPI0039BEB113
MQNDPGKSIKNSLFNPNVTGSTYEDFAQHAMIFPAQAPSVSPSYTEQDQQIPEISTTSNNFTIEPDYQPEQFGEVTIQDDYSQQPSNISSFLSSFSNIWKPSSSSEQQENFGVTQQIEPTQPPTIGDYFASSSPQTQTREVPFYSPTDVPIGPPPPSTTTTNTYRRSGLKRAVYAPVPGLSKPQDQPNIFDANYIQPISSNVLTPDTLPEVQRSITPKQIIQEPKSSESNSPFLSPVQDLSEPFVKMPVNEVPNSNSNNLPYAYRQDNFLPTSNAEVTNSLYRPVYQHWFYRKNKEAKTPWLPFSMHDSQNLEAAFTSTDLSPETVVKTDGGRYDVNILRRERISVYWKSNPTEVKRCSWFHRHTSGDGKYIPFDENIAAKLEDEYKIAFETNQWHRKVDIQNGETVILHGVDVLILFPSTPSPDTWGNAPQNQIKPRIVKRGMDEFDIDEGESETVDHLLFMVHGIGAACDLKFRSVEDVVDEFRSIALQLVRAHYRSSCDRKIVHRVEVLPVSWHEKLHCDDTGIDNKLKSITLESIPKLREFTNDTLLDILFYTSPVYGQTIITSVSNEINSVYELFKQRNPSFNGGVSLGGHSLGSLILFDILRNQRTPAEPQKEIGDLLQPDNAVSLSTEEKPHPMNRSMSRRFSYVLGTVGTGQPEIMYPQLAFQPHTFFALGSPIGMFVTVRGLETLGETFKLPTCSGFFNIFHPYDPVAYRIESLVNEKLADIKPVLIPHHKGRKRMHLELKETMTRVGADIKQKVMDSMKNTWNSFFQGWTSNKPSLEEEVDKAIEEGFSSNNQENNNENQENEKTDLCLGLLNKGRRIDYVLQEAPVEFFNEYIFTLSSHLCYWESEDTILMMLKEIYGTLNISPDNQIPQQTMTIERPPSSPQSARSYVTSTTVNNSQLGVNPTLPMNKNADIGPPPVSGFVRKS